MTLALLLTAVGGAWAQAPTIYFQQDYSSETVDWSTGTSGRFTPIVQDGYLTVTQDQRQNNGTTLTCTATQGKVDAGKDFTMSFNVKLGASTNQSATAFNIYDAANSAPILSFAEGSVGATAWKINQGTQTATVSAGGGKSIDELSWIFVQVTSIAGGKTYLTLKDDQNNIIDGFDKTEIPTLSVAGGLGKITFVTSRYLANFAIDNVLVSEVVNDEPATEPAIEVTTNAASKQDLFTTASFKMPTFDVDVNYELVRDMQDETNPVAFSGLPSNDEPIVVKKGSDGKYQPIEALNIQLIDPVAAAEAQNIIAADGITVTVLVGNGGTPIEYDQEPPITLEAFLADVKPGYYWIKAEQTDENSPYDGTVYSSQFAVVEQYDLTVKPADEYSKGKLDKVTVGTEEITPDATTGKATKNGIDPGTEVKLKAKRGYVIEKVEAKKTVFIKLNAAKAENIGMVVCNKGHLHDAKEAVPDGCTAVGILGKVTGTGHGLILALKNATNQNWNTINGWTSASYAGTTLKVLPDGARGTNLTSYTTLGETTVSNWAVAQKSDYAAIFANLGSTKGDNEGKTFDGNVNAYITTGVGGTAISGDFWSATSSTDAQAWRFISVYWSRGYKTNSRTVRPVLGF